MNRMLIASDLLESFRLRAEGLLGYLAFVKLDYFLEPREVPFLLFYTPDFDGMRNVELGTLLGSVFPPGILTEVPRSGFSPMLVTCAFGELLRHNDTDGFQSSFWDVITSIASSGDGDKFDPRFVGREVWLFVLDVLAVIRVHGGDVSDELYEVRETFLR